MNLRSRGERVLLPFMEELYNAQKSYLYELNRKSGRVQQGAASQAEAGVWLVHDVLHVRVLRQEWAQIGHPWRMLTFRRMTVVASALVKFSQVPFQLLVVNFFVVETHS